MNKTEKRAIKRAYKQLHRRDGDGTVPSLLQGWHGIGDSESHYEYRFVDIDEDEVWDLVEEDIRFNNGLMCTYYVHWAPNPVGISIILCYGYIL